MDALFTTFLQDEKKGKHCDNLGQDHECMNSEEFSRCDPIFERAQDLFGERVVGNWRVEIHASFGSLFEFL